MTGYGGRYRYPLCAGGCGKRLVPERRLVTGGRRLEIRNQMCAVCLEQRMTPRRRGPITEAPALNTGEIEVVRIIGRLPPEDRATVAGALGLPTELPAGARTRA